MKKLQALFTFLFSFALLLISGAAVISYLFDLPRMNLSVLFPDAVAMRFNTALSFFCISLSVFCYQLQFKQSLQILFLFLVAAVSSVTVINHLFGLNLYIDFTLPSHILDLKYHHLIRSSVYTSSLLFLLSLSFFCLIGRVLSSAWLASLAFFILSFAILMMIGVFLKFPLGKIKPLNEYVALITTIEFVIASFILLIHSLKTYKSRQRSSYLFIPLWVGMLALSLSFALFMTWASYYDSNAKLQAEHQLRSAGEVIQNDIDAVEKSMHRMADRWMFAKGLKEDVWKNDARRSVEDLKYLKYIIKIDANEVPLWAVHLDPDSKKDLPSREFFENIRGELNKAYSADRPHYELGADLFNGEQDLIIFFPLKIDGVKDGFFVAGLEEKDIIDDLINKSGIRFLKVRSANRDLATKDLSAEMEHLREVTAEIYVGDYSYSAIGFYPNPTITSGHVLVVFVVSVSIAALFLIVLYLKFSADCQRISAEFNEKIARVTLEDSVLGVLRVNRKGFITYCNAAAGKILGYDESELRGQDLNVLIPPDLRDSHGDHFRRYLEAPYSRKMFVLDREIEGYRKDGTYVPIEVSLSYVRVGDEDEMLAFIYDMTDKAERNRFFDMSLDLIAVVTTDDNLKEVNSSWTEILGYKAEELIGRSFLSFIHSDDRPQMREVMNETKTHRGNLRLECRMMSPAGNERWFWWSGSVFQRKLYLNGRDITDQKHKARIVEQLNESYEIINSVSNVGIWQWDVPANTVRWSPRFYQLLGYRDKEFESSIERYYTLIHPSDKEAMTKRIDSRFGGEAKIDNELRLKTKSGAYRWYRIMGVVISNSSGEITRIMGSLQDIHPIKQAEEFAERKISRYLGELQRSNRELEQFAYIASHDLQTPLRHIMSFTNLLTKKLKLDDDAETSQWLGYINQGVKQMEQLILDLLSYSRVRKDDFKRETVDLNEVVQSIKDVNLDLQSEGTLTIEALPKVSGYSTHLRQLFQNLIGNAAKFSRNDVPIQIRVASKENENEWIISVADNGIGINEDQFERVFQLFQRLHPKGRYEGTGIGLAICKKAAELHGGRIWLESKVGLGTTFFVSISKQQESTNDQD